MARGNLIPYDTIRLIIIRLVSPSVKSLDDWADCIKVLAVSRMWRAIGEPMLYANLVISLEALNNVIPTIHSNTSLVISNSFENHVRATVVHISPSVNTHDTAAALYWHMPNYLTDSLNSQSTMNRIWSVVGAPTFLLSGACIEPLLLTMPNLRYLFIEGRFMGEPRRRFTNTFLHYSVARQASFARDVRLFAEHDFVASFSHEIITAINIQTAMTRMTHVPSSREQTPASTSRRSYVPLTDRVLFCAEYIRRLHILDLPDSALSLGSSVNELRDRNPCTPEENNMHSMWYYIRYRSLLCVPNIWFENSRVGIARYDLFAFNRSANDHMLQIATSVPAEVSEPAQLPDNSSENESSGSDSDDN